MVRVTDVAPDGTSRELTNGLQAATFRAVDEDRSRIVDGWNLQPWHPYTPGSVQPMPPGEAVPVDVEVFSTAAVVPAGHRLRISVGTADFPHAVSPLPRLAASRLTAVQVHHGPDMPSHLVLPVVGAPRAAPAPPDDGLGISASVVPPRQEPASSGPAVDDVPQAGVAAAEGASAPGAPLPATGGGAAAIATALLALSALTRARRRSRPDG